MNNSLGLNSVEKLLRLAQQREDQMRAQLASLRQNLDEIRGALRTIDIAVESEKPSVQDVSAFARFVETSREKRRLLNTKISELAGAENALLDALYASFVESKKLEQLRELHTKSAQRDCRMREQRLSEELFTQSRALTQAGGTMPARFRGS
ncbi:MAG: hypothetical protein AAGB02_07865 [Pseudomonadota bacterium]